jgi:hypothetical protein
MIDQRTREGNSSNRWENRIFVIVVIVIIVKVALLWVWFG